MPGSTAGGGPPLRAKGICFRNESIAVLIRGRATTEQSQDALARIPKLMPLPRQNRYRIAGAHVAQVSVDSNSSSPMGDIINLLSSLVIMFLRAAARGQPGLRQTL